MQREKVIKPPLISSVSVDVNSRAPRRTNTLSWLFIFFSFHHGVRWKRPQSRSKGFARLPTSGEEAPGLKKMVATEGRHRCSAMGPALANLGISVPVRASLSGDGAKGFSMQPSANALHFLRTQFMSAPAN